LYLSARFAWGNTNLETSRRLGSYAETFAARATRLGIGVRKFEPSRDHCRRV